MSASPSPLLRPAPAPYFHLLFKIFQILPPPSPGEVIKIYSLPLKKGGSELCLVNNYNTYINQHLTKKKQPDNETTSVNRI